MTEAPDLSAAPLAVYVDDERPDRVVFEQRPKSEVRIQPLADGRQVVVQDGDLDPVAGPEGVERLAGQEAVPLDPVDLQVDAVGGLVGDAPPDELAAHIRAEPAKWRKVIQAGNISLK